jgi:hypothetical protein
MTPGKIKAVNRLLIYGNLCQSAKGSYNSTLKFSHPVFLILRLCQFLNFAADFVSVRDKAFVKLFLSKLEINPGDLRAIWIALCWVCYAYSRFA